MNPFTTGLAAAAIPGAVSAVITRILMRAVSVVANTEPSFSLVESSSILVIYIAFLLPGCIALAWSRAWWPWLLFVGGATALMLSALTIGLAETASAHEMTPIRWVLLVLVLVGMLATYAAQFAVAASWARRGAAPRLRRPGGGAAFQPGAAGS